MQLSSILVYCNPEQIEETISALSELPNVEVHYHYQDSGQLVITQESEVTISQADGLKIIKSIPSVMAAEIVYHHVEEGHKPETVSAPNVRIV